MFFSNCSALTRINEELISETRMVDVVDSSGKNGGHYFQIGKCRLRINRKKERNTEMC